ncbi:MAG: cytochrome c maturation protein CcmE, partial [Planctomycetales bacterium]|nr:cytochrome c maturation protein CcmE [Planctomycetales bacterium]
SGEVVPGSLEIAADGHGAEFQLGGNGRNLHVSYRGQVPLNLAESRQVVVEGVVTDRCVIRAEQVLTRCSSKYTAKLPAEYSADSDAGIVR